MLTKIDPKVWDKVVNGTKDERVYICEKEFYYFALYYFSEFFSYKIPTFHYWMYNDLKEMLNRDFSYLMWIMFRESAKTSLIKIFVVWLILYKKKRYINFDSYDKGNAESSLFDIANWLQTNPKIIADFGQLYYDPKKEDKKSIMKRVSEFVTVNDIKVQAFSTGEATRGRVYKEFRPDFFVLDDFETNKTKKSLAVTQSVIEHINELLAGVSPDANVVFLCNLITESGSVQEILNRSENNPQFRVRRVDVEMNGQIMWPDKYVPTDTEAANLNKEIAEDRKQKVSLESKKRTLTPRVYAVEMMNNPQAAGDNVFDRDKIDLALEESKKHTYETFGELHVWEKYRAGERYGIGGDTAKGVGRDSNASVVINFSKNIVVATYANNQIPPDLFAYELKTQGDMFGYCLIAPEINNTGYATITQLKQIYNKKKIYTKVKKDFVTNIETEQLGWETTGSNKAEIIYQFKQAFENGELIIWDAELLQEMRKYGLPDLQASATDEAKTTRHFDKLMAACIAWEMRHYAKLNVIPTTIQGGIKDYNL